MTNLTIATWNLENLDDRNTKEWNNRLPVMHKMLERIKADVLLLQEVNTLTALNTFKQGTFCENFNVAITQENNELLEVRNLVILSRFPISEFHSYKHEFVDKPEWRKVTADPPQQGRTITWERPLLFARISLVGVNLHVINIHLKSFGPTTIPGQQDPQQWWKWLSHSGWAEGYYISDIKRVGQALETRRLVDSILDNDIDSLVAVGGDFNADIGSVPFKAVVGSVEDTSNPSLRSKVLIPCELNVPNSQRYSLIYRGKGEMIDHLTVSEKFYPYWQGTEIFNELLPDESIAFATDVKFPESDHAPVIAKFDVPSSWIP